MIVCGGKVGAGIVPDRGLFFGNIDPYHPQETAADPYMIYRLLGDTVSHEH